MTVNFGFLLLTALTASTHMTRPEVGRAVLSIRRWSLPRECTLPISGRASGSRLYPTHVETSCWIAGLAAAAALCVLCQSGCTTGDECQIVDHPGSGYVPGSGHHSFRRSRRRFFHQGTLQPPEQYTQSLECSYRLQRAVRTAHCLGESGIFADNGCDAGTWNEGVIAVKSECEGDSIKFQLRNVGPGDMTKASLFTVITEDVVIFLKDDNVRLTNWRRNPISIPTTHTYRLEVRQPDGYPGVSHTFIPKVRLSLVGTHSPGIITQFPNV